MNIQRDQKAPPSRQWLTDPVNFANLKLAVAAGQALYNDRLKAASAEVKKAGRDTVMGIALFAEFNALAVEQRNFMMAILTAG